MTEQYGSAIAAGDTEAIREFWNPQSPNMASRLGVYQKFFSTSRIEFVNPKVTKLDVAGERAVSHLTADERLLDKVTGTALTEHDLFHRASRSVEWIKTDGRWKIERESSLQEELAAKLECLVSEDERRELLEKEKALVTNVLVRALIDRSSRHRLNSDFERATGSIRLAEAIAEQIGDRAGLAKAWLYLALVIESKGVLEQTLPFRHARSRCIKRMATNSVRQSRSLASVTLTSRPGITGRLLKVRRSLCGWLRK